MRSKDLKTDGVTTYYYTTQETWLKWSHHPEQVRILDATPGHWRWEAREDKWVRRDGGQQILVEVLAKGGNAARRMAVRSQCIRGEWDACVKQRADLHAEKSQTDQQRRDRLRAIADPCLEAAADLVGLGIAADVDEDARNLYAQIVISHRALPALRAAIAHLIATGWTAPKN
jgi:hypothetical protein